MSLLQDFLVDDLAVRVNLVHDRDTGRELGRDDLLRRHVLERHDNSTQRVTVGSNKNRLALLDQRLNLLVKERQHTVGRELQRLTARRAHIERAAPGVYLLLAELGTSIVLVQASELAVVTLVQRLVLDDRDALLADGLELDVQRLLGTLESGGEGNAIAVLARVKHMAEYVLEFGLEEETERQVSITSFPYKIRTYPYFLSSSAPLSASSRPCSVRSGSFQPVNCS